MRSTRRSSSYARQHCCRQALENEKRNQDYGPHHRGGGGGGSGRCRRTGRAHCDSDRHHGAARSWRVRRFFPFFPENPRHRGGPAPLLNFGGGREGENFLHLQFVSRAPEGWVRGGKKRQQK